MALPEIGGRWAGNCKSYFGRRGPWGAHFARSGNIPFLFVYVWLSMFVFSYVSGPQSIPKIEFSKKIIPLFQQVAPAARGLAWGGWGRSPVVENCVEQCLKGTFFLDLPASS